MRTVPTLRNATRTFIRETSGDYRLTAFEKWAQQSRHPWILAQREHEVAVIELIEDFWASRKTRDTKTTGRQKLVRYPANTTIASKLETPLYFGTTNAACVAITNAAISSEAGRAPVDEKQMRRYEGREGSTRFEKDLPTIIGGGLSAKRWTPLYRKIETAIAEAVAAQNIAPADLKEISVAYLGPQLAGGLNAQNIPTEFADLWLILDFKFIDIIEQHTIPINIKFAAAGNDLASMPIGGSSTLAFALLGNPAIRKERPLRSAMRDYLHSPTYLPPADYFIIYFQKPSKTGERFLDPTHCGITSRLQADPVAGHTVISGHHNDKTRLRRSAVTLQPKTPTLPFGALRYEYMDWWSEEMTTELLIPQIETLPPRQRARIAAAVAGRKR